MIQDNILVESIHQEMANNLLKSGHPINKEMVKIATEVCLAFIEAERGTLIYCDNPFVRKSYTDDLTVDAILIKEKYRKLKNTI